MALINILRSNRDRDLTSCNISTGILGLAVPMITASIFHSFQSLVDLYFVGKLVPAAPAVAAVGMAGTVLFLLVTVFMGTHTAVVALVSRAIGSDNTDRADHIAGQALVLTALLSVVIGTVGFIWSPDILSGLGAKAEVVRLGTGYMQVVFGGIFFLVSFFVLTGIFQGAGDTMTPLYLGVVTTIINIIMTPILIHGYLGFPKLGVTGSGVATLVARALALAVGFFILYQGKMRVTVRLKDIRPCFKTLWQIIVVGVPSSLQMSTRMIMNLILMAIVAKFGTVAVAAYTVGMRIRMIGLFPSFGFGGAAATMVGQNLGADRPERSKRGGWMAAGMGFLVTGLMGLLFYIFAEPVIAFFNNDPKVIATGATFLRVTALGLVSAPFGIIFSRALNGAGDTTSPLVISLACLWGFQIPAALYLSGIHTLWGFEIPGRSLFEDWAPYNVTGVWWAMVAASVLQAIVTAGWFNRGGWQHKKV